MGRPKKEIDSLALLDLLQDGHFAKDIASEFEVSVPTLSKKIAELQKNHGILTKYNSIQRLELTALQERVLAAITPEKIEEAPLKDLVVAFKILKDKELVMGGNPSEIKGLVGYLIQMEKESVNAGIVEGIVEEEDKGYYENDQGHGHGSINNKGYYENSPVHGTSLDYEPEEVLPDL